MNKPWIAHFESDIKSHEWILREILISKKISFWNEVLQIHDTHGVPFDLIKISLDKNKHLPKLWNSEDFKMFMLSVRHYVSY